MTLRGELSNLLASCKGGRIAECRIIEALGPSAMTTELRAAITSSHHTNHRRINKFTQMEAGCELCEWREPGPDKSAAAVH